MMSSMRNDEDITNENIDKSIRNLLKDFGVKTEEELSKKLFDDFFTLPCVCCKREFPIQEMKFFNSDPYCKDCF